MPQREQCMGRLLATLMALRSLVNHGVRSAVAPL